MKIQHFSRKIMKLKIPSTKWLPVFLGLNVWTHGHRCLKNTTWTFWLSGWPEVNTMAADAPIYFRPQDIDSHGLLWEINEFRSSARKYFKYQQHMDVRECYTIISRFLRYIRRVKVAAIRRTLVSINMQLHAARDIKINIHLVSPGFENVMVAMCHFSHK